MKDIHTGKPRKDMAKKNKSAVLWESGLGGDSGGRAGRLLAPQYQKGERLDCRGPVG